MPGETEYYFGSKRSVCVVCGRADSLLVPYGEDDFACVECVSMENGETTTSEDEDERAEA